MRMIRKICIALLLMLAAPALAQAPSPTIANTPIGAVNTESQKASYAQCTGAPITLAAGGDLFTFQGSATRTIHVTQVVWSGTITAATDLQLILIRRSTGGTGGTTQSPDGFAKLDTNNATATATMVAYTTPPTSGTANGTLARAFVFMPTPTTGSSPWAWVFSTHNDQGIILRGTSDYLALQMPAGAAGAGNSQVACVYWNEEP